MNDHFEKVPTFLEDMTMWIKDGSIVTSVFCKFPFLWGPWKLYGALAFYQDFYVVVGVWTFSVFFSMLWLRFFAFGPLEWAWRSLTYWKRQPFLIVQAA